MAGNTTTNGSHDHRPRREVAIMGAGYVGLPLAHVFASAGVGTVLVDVDADKVASINQGVSYIPDVPTDDLARLVKRGTLSASTDVDAVRECDAILIALPTPLTPNREPDLTIVLEACAKLAPRLRAGHLVVLESTTYPGTTRDEILPLFVREGFEVGRDFFLAFSPERVDPGREDWTTQNTPKVVGGVTAACTERACALYGRALETLVPVSSPEVAELTKLLENIFRSVNIALVNELAQMCDRMGLDVWEVVDAASTKPFGYMRFEPGPGLGGHCLPIDPFYLSWKARQFDFYTEFIELAGKINDNMPYYCVETIARALNSRERSLRGSRVALLGVAYKPDVGDVRESPALRLIELMQRSGAEVSYVDEHVPELHELGLVAQSLDEALAEADCICIVTAHRGVDYQDVVERASLVVDLRNATGPQRYPHVWTHTAPHAAAAELAGVSH
ncbi:MAG: nucleotide sugar dehydrogenase [Thermoleophilia bacterium]